jgi:hypothetical protein
MELVIDAQDKGAGMQPDEIMQAIVRARSAGCTVLFKTRLGWRGQIQVMIFREPMGTADLPARITPPRQSRATPATRRLDSVDTFVID